MDSPMDGKSGHLYFIVLSVDFSNALIDQIRGEILGALLAWEDKYI